MKKFTLTLMAVLMALIAWAQPADLKNRQQMVSPLGAKTARAFKQVPKKMVRAPRPAPKGTVQVPVQNAPVKKMRAGAKKALERQEGGAEVIPHILILKAERVHMCTLSVF